MTGPRVVVGAGANIFAAHLRGLRAIEADLVGIYDLDTDAAQRVAASLGTRAHASLDSLLAEPADLAVILTPHPFHAELAIACLQAGRHVLVEKPIAVDVGDADRMVDTAARQGLLLAVAFQHRTRREVQAARQLVRSGELGEIQRVDLLATWPRRAAYFRTAPWRGSWRGEGGGVLINQGQHDLDLLCYVAGLPARLVGVSRTRLQPIETEDTVEALLEWQQGALGSIHLSTVEVDERQRLEVTGSAGRLRLLPGRLELVRNAEDFRTYHVSAGNPYAPPETEPGRDIEGAEWGHELVYRNLARALTDGEALLASGRAATAALELANAITLSSQQGGVVTLPVDRAAYAQLLRDLRR